MSRAHLRILLLALVIGLLAGPAWAQYGGTFGKNKISYERFDWQVYRSPHFDVYYYTGMEPFLEEIVSDAESAYLKLSKDLDHELKFRVPLVTFRTHGEFQQTNITLSELPEGVGAFAEPAQYRMVLPIDLPPDKLYHLIAHELTHIFQYSIFYEGYLGRAIRARPPLWLMEGMASFLADDEDNLDRMAIRDAVVNNILPPIQALDVLSFMTYRYGHAIFDYIEQEHGMEGVRSFIFEFKKVMMSGNIAKAIKEAFGYDIDEFNRRFNRYLRKKYFPVLLEKKSPDEYGVEIGGTPSGNDVAFSPSISPSGELIAALGLPKMELDLVIIAAEDGRIVRNLTKGWTNDYRGLVTEVFSGRRDLSWSPTADQVAVFARRENKWPLLVYDALKGKQIHDIVFDDIFECSSPMFSPDGRRIAFEGNRNGVVDLFEYNLDTEEVRNLTQDEFFDANPWYAADGKSLLYNRRIGEHWKVFSVDLNDASKKTQLTFGASSDIQPSYSRDGSTVYFSSDRGSYGVFNLYSLDLTTGDMRQFTDVVGGTFGPVEMAERDDETYLVFTAFFRGGFRLYRMPLRTPELKIEASERLSETTDVKPFEPELQLKVDENQKAPYKAKWDVDSPSVNIGVANDGTLLTNIGIQFTDLMGDQRAIISAGSVSDFASYGATYLNLKRRFNWGASAFDYRDYFIDASTGTRLERQNSRTGVSAFIQYPFNRYYRTEASVGFLDRGYNQYLGPNLDGSPAFAEIKDQLATVSVSLVGDTTRYQSFGAFQGKRLDVGVFYGEEVGGELGGDWLEYRLDFRAYKSVTRRSLFAWRLAGIINDGQRTVTYGFGGLNQLRGFDFREFFGSNLAWSNLEYRFPLIDEMRFPIMALQQIRGFFFLDVGAAWYSDDSWYDPVTRRVQADYSDPLNPEIIPFQFWDSDNGRLGNGRAAYGFGFQFIFIGGLQFNWIWANRLPYTQVLYEPDGSPYRVESPDVGTLTEFYIMWDW